MAFRVFLIFLLVLGLQSHAQINHPKASPFMLLEQEVGLSKITVNYSRPATRGRKIFGELVPYGRIWRVGANESTKIMVDNAMEVEGNNLPAGTYALYAFPEAGYWEIAFHTNTTHWGDGRKKYNSDEDLFRIRVKPEQIPYHQENFLISFDSITHDSAKMNLTWEKTKVSIPFKVDTQTQMQQEIAEQIARNPSAQTYYEAARYFQEQGIQTEMGLKYVNIALELAGDTYYFHRVKSLLLAEMKSYMQAIEAAKKSLILAEQLGKDEFVRMNQKNIDTWNSILDSHK